MDSKQLTEMKMHDKIEVSSFLDVVRVPGGWIYLTWLNDHVTSSVFVPWDIELSEPVTELPRAG